jgi:hypothetical protein
MTGKKDVVLHTGNQKSDLSIKEFTFDKFVAHPAIVMIAKRGSGKSWVVRAVLNYFRDIPVGLIISKTDKMNRFYADFFPDTYIHYDYTSEIIESVMTRQEDMIEKKQEKNANGHGKKLDTRCFVVMDDCLGQKGKWVRDPPIQELLFNGRHYHIMYILTMQFPLGITPELRNNFDYIFLLADDIISNLKRMHDHYAGVFPTFDSFRQIFSQLTDDHGSMVIVNRGTGKTIFEKIFWYKAPDFTVQDVEMGCKQFQTFHKNNYDATWNKKKRQVTNNGVNNMLMQKKKSGSAIVVEKARHADEILDESSNKNETLKKKGSRH